MVKILSQTSKGEIEAPDCPKCGSDDVIGITRVVGYYSRINNWNKSKHGEQIDRQRGNYEFGDKTSDLDSRYGGDGVEIHLYGKAGCSMCGGAERQASHILDKEGLSGLIKIVKHEIADKDGVINPEALSLLAGINGSPTQIPYIAVTNNGRLVYSAGTRYSQDKPAQLPRKEEILEAVRYCISRQTAAA